jgi:hypothetical protein
MFRSALEAALAYADGLKGGLHRESPPPTPDGSESGQDQAGQFFSGRAAGHPVKLMASRPVEGSGGGDVISNSSVRRPQTLR